jgi:polyribonucleotide nucleotidyltransferase
MNVQSVSIEVGGRPLTIETGKLAKQSNGAVVVRQDDSMVLVTACASKDDVPFDFLPLTVVYQDRTAASGSIPGGFLKSEGRPNERETLISRLIDRPVRPQFPKYFRREMQVIATVMSYDPASDTDVLSMCGTAAAFAVSDIPMTDPIAGVRIIRLNGEWLINPSLEQQAGSDINLVVAGSRAGISMVEGAASEAPESAMMEAMELAFVEIQKIIDGIEELQAKVAPIKFEVEAPADINEEVKAALLGLGAQEKLNDAMGIPGKHECNSGLKNTRNALIEALVDGEDEETVASMTKDAKKIWDKMVSETMRRNVVESGIRIDGRQTDEIRPIWIEVGVAPRVHGSTIFTRGETQAFVTATLGTEVDAQHVDFADEKEDRRWMLQYNFPPFSTGEVRRMGGPKRREVGHGKLAHRALEPVFPSAQEYKYVVRCSSDVLESNGSSSMATVCGATLSMLDAGVPLKAPVAGIAMGLIKLDDNYVVLSDILGDEDHLGDMDFKVTGTPNGITAFQMDTKLGSIPREVMNKAMTQAKEGRMHILGKMAEVIDAPRQELSPFAPRITSIQIKPDKIRDVIGKGGVVIKEIQSTCDVRVSIEDSGQVDVISTNADNAKRAIEWIEGIVREPELNELYMSKVIGLKDFGVIVELFPGNEMLLHISEWDNTRTASLEGLVNVGDEILIKVINGRKGLTASRKAAFGESV